MMERMFDEYAELCGMAGGIACSVLLDKINAAEKMKQQLKRKKV